jgi:type I restriction enzyme S subunit
MDSRSRYKLGELTNWLSGGTPSKREPSFWSGDIPWISASSMTGSRYSNSDLNITMEGLKSGSRLAAKGSILLLVRGSTLHNRIPVGIAEIDVAFNQDVKAITVNDWALKNKITSNEYIFYWLRANEKLLLEKVEHTGIGAGKLDTKVLQNLLVDLPPMEVQNFIVSIGSDLDNKEILKNKTNQTLEEMAQAIFKSWFVDFDPVKAKAQVIAQGGSEQDANLAAMQIISGKTRDQLAALEHTHPEQYTQLHTTASLFPSAFVDSELGEIPEGWSVESISDHLDTISKTFRFEDEKKVIFLNTGDIKEGAFLHDNFSATEGLPGQAKKSIRKNDILFSEIRPINRRHAYVDFDSEDYVVSTKLMVLRSKGKICSRYLYFILTQNSSIELLQILAESRSGTFPQITFDSLSSVKFVIPNRNELLDTFSKKYLQPKMKIFHQKQIESQRLAELRDQLLPKLLSGEIDVSQLHLND